MVAKVTTNQLPKDKKNKKNKTKQLITMYNVSVD